MGVSSIPFGRFVLRRVSIGVGQLLVLLVLVFVLSLLLPGHAADVRNDTVPDAQRRGGARESLGPDTPPAQRFLHWLAHAVTGDFDVSYANGVPVADLIVEPFGVTALMAVLSSLLLAPLAVTLGLAAGLRPGSRRDRVITTLCVGLDSVPDFVLAILLVTSISLEARLLPTPFPGTEPSTILHRPEYLVLPLVVMVIRVAAPVVPLVRAGVVDVLDRPYIAQARRLGVAPGSLLTRHIAPNALAPAARELGRTGGGLLSRVLVVEAVFIMPGITAQLIEAIGNRDDPVILAIVLTTGTAVIVTDLVIDLVGRRLVPPSAEGVRR